MTELEFNEWAKTLPQPQQTIMLTRYMAGDAAGFVRGAAAAAKERAMNRWLIPVAVFGPFVGLLIQRYLIVLG